jgi:hypothetical protein
MGKASGGFVLLSLVPLAVVSSSENTAVTRLADIMCLGRRLSKALWQFAASSSEAFRDHLNSLIHSSNRPAGNNIYPLSVWRIPEIHVMQSEASCHVR